MYVTMSATPVYNQALDSPVKVRECYTSKQLAILLISQYSVVFVHFVWFQLTMPWKLAFLEFIRSNQSDFNAVLFTAAEIHVFKFVFRHFVSIFTNLSNPCYFSVCCY